MSFDRTKAQLSDDQLDMSEALDTIYETGKEGLDDGFTWDDIGQVSGMISPVMAIVGLVRGAKSKEALANMIAGAGAGVWNDNFPFLTIEALKAEFADMAGELTGDA